MQSLKARLYTLLRWSEKYTKTDMLYASKSGFWLMSGQIVSAVAALGLSIIFANFLSKDVFGMYRYVLSMAGVAAAFSLTGANAAVVRAVAQGFDDILVKAIIAQAWWSIPRVVFGLAVSGYYFYQNHIVYGIAFLVVALLAPIATIGNTYAPFLEGKKLFKTSSIYGILMNASQVLVLALVSVFIPSVVLLILAYYTTLTASGLYFTWKTFRKFRTSEKQTRSEDMQYAKELSVMNVISTLATQADSILIYHLLGPAQLAVYTFATLIPERIRSMFGIIAVAAFPKLAEKQAAREGVRILDKVLRLVALSFIIVIGYVIVAPYVFSILFPEYIASVHFSQVYAFSLVAIASNIPIPLLFAGKKKFELYTINIGIPIIKIVISVIGILYIGIWGAILAKIVHYVIYLGLSTYFAIRAKTE